MTAGEALQPLQQQLAGAGALSYVAQTRAGGVIMSSSHERGDPPDQVRAGIAVVRDVLDEELNVTLTMFMGHRPLDLIHHRATRIAVVRHPGDQQVDEPVTE